MWHLYLPKDQIRNIVVKIVLDGLSKPFFRKTIIKASDNSDNQEWGIFYLQLLEQGQIDCKGF